MKRNIKRPGEEKGEEQELHPEGHRSQGRSARSCLHCSCTAQLQPCAILQAGSWDHIQPPCPISVLCGQRDAKGSSQMLLCVLRGLTGAGEDASHVCLPIYTCPWAGCSSPGAGQREAEGGGGCRKGWGSPPHLAGLVMMRAEKSKRFLLIFRRVLTSSSSSLTWIVRCSWSPIRFFSLVEHI